MGDDDAGNDTIDGSATEAKQREEKPRVKRQREPTRKPCTIDWGAIKRDWNVGLTAKEIAEKYGVGLSSVYSRAQKDKWPDRETMIQSRPDPETPKAVIQRAIEKAAEKTISQQMPAVNELMRQRLNEWFERILATSDKLQRQIESKAEGHLEVEEIKSLSSSAETIDRVARRTFGLDSPGASTVSVFSVASPSINCPVIDVDALPLASPASVAQ